MSPETVCADTPRRAVVTETSPETVFTESSASDSPTTTSPEARRDDPVALDRAELDVAACGGDATGALHVVDVDIPACRLHPEVAENAARLEVGRAGRALDGGSLRAASTEIVMSAERENSLRERFGSEIRISVRSPCSRASTVIAAARSSASRPRGLTVTSVVVVDEEVAISTSAEPSSNRSSGATGVSKA